MLSMHSRFPLCVLVAAAAILASSACRPKPASVEDLYTTRMLGLSYLQRNELPQAESAFTKLTNLAPDDPLGYASLDSPTYKLAATPTRRSSYAGAGAGPGEYRSGTRAGQTYSLTGARRMREKRSRSSAATPLEMRTSCTHSPIWRRSRAIAHRSERTRIGSGICWSSHQRIWSRD